jgi:tetratricopeptide (TPR) repeat protein
MYLGVALLRLRKLDEAEKELLMAVASERKDLGMAHYYLGGIYWGKREYRRAADELEKYLSLTPNAPDAQRLSETVKELRSKN